MLIERFQNDGAFHFAEEALLLEAEGKMEYVISCQGKSKFCKEQVQVQETSSNLVYYLWLMNSVMGSYISFRTPWDFASYQQR